MPSRFIFRMMHVSNLENYFRDGCINAKNHGDPQLGFQISYSSIVNRRGEEYFTPCEHSVNDFVPFYFSPATSMAYAISQGKVPLRDQHDVDSGFANIDDVAFVVCNVQKFADCNESFWFTNIACNSGITPLFENDLSKIESNVNWSLFDADPKMGKIEEIGYRGVCKYCTDSDLDPAWQNRTKQRMAEFLVKGAFSMSLVDCVILKHDGRKADVEEWIERANLDIPTFVKKRCYF